MKKLYVNIFILRAETYCVEISDKRYVYWGYKHYFYGKLNEC